MSYNLTAVGVVAFYDTDKIKRWSPTSISKMAMKQLLIFLLLIACMLLFCSATLHGDDIITKKVQTALLNLLATDDPALYAETHGIRMKDGMVRVIVTVNEDFSEEIISQYEPCEYKKKGDLIFAFIAVDNLRRLCKEESVDFIRLPTAFDAMSGHELQKR